MIGNEMVRELKEEKSKGGCEIKIKDKDKEGLWR
jgi:hypothetical protein